MEWPGRQTDRQTRENAIIMRWGPLITKGMKRSWLATKVLQRPNSRNSQLYLTFEIPYDMTLRYNYDDQ